MVAQAQKKRVHSLVQKPICCPSVLLLLAVLHCFATVYISKIEKREKLVKHSILKVRMELKIGFIFNNYSHRSKCENCYLWFFLIMEVLLFTYLKHFDQVHIFFLVKHIKEFKSRYMVFASHQPYGFVLWWKDSKWCICKTWDGIVIEMISIVECRDCLNIYECDIKLGLVADPVIEAIEAGFWGWFEDGSPSWRLLVPFRAGGTGGARGATGPPRFSKMK